MPASSDRMLARYRLTEKIGEGGMGIVYRAEDTTLHRPVALKFLTEKAYSRQERRARFLREARLAAALNHPTVCTIYEVGTSPSGEERTLPGGAKLPPDTPFIAMELIEGGTLSQHLTRAGSLPLAELLRIASRIAEGLVVAHAGGIVHRDLKPGNVMLTADGRVKILDFGLAKPVEPADSEGLTRTQTDTVSQELTREGLVVGTAAYMSPEQVRGEPLGSRSDIFSFGVMLYEMAFSMRPFRGDSSSATMLRIIEAEPEPFPESRTDLPLELERIIRRCLKKNPEDRYNDTRDLLASLKDLTEETSSGRQTRISAGRSVTREVPAVSGRGRLARWGLTIASLVALTLVLAAYLFFPRSDSKSSTLPLHRRLTFSGIVSQGDISADGQYLAYVESPDAEKQILKVRDLSGSDEQALEIFEAIRITGVRWSPDAQELLVAAQLDPTDPFQRIQVLPRFGGPPRQLPDKPNIFAWSPRGTLIARAYQPEKAIWITNKFTGESSKFPLEGDFRFIHDVDWSPSGNTLLLWTHGHNGWRAWTVSPEGGQTHGVLEKTHVVSPRWSADEDSIYYVRERGSASDLMKVRIDPASGEVLSDPVPVLTGLNQPSMPSFSRDGRRMAYVKTTNKANLWELEVQDENGGKKVLTRRMTSGAFVTREPALSPDGQTLAFSRNRQIHILPIDGGPPRQLTFLKLACRYPAWSPDGKRIAFIAGSGEATHVWVVSADGSKAREFDKTHASGQLAWAPFDRVLFQREGNRNYHLLDPDTEEETPLLDDDSGGWLFRPRIAPDATHVATWWNRHDNDEDGVWLIPLDGSAGKLILSGTLTPIDWSADGSRLYALNEWPRPQAIVEIQVDGGSVETIAETPFAGAIKSCRMTVEDSEFVCSIDESTSDIWLVENFDPDP